MWRKIVTFVSIIYNRFGQTHNHHDKNKSVAYRQNYVHCNIRCRMLGY